MAISILESWRHETAVLGTKHGKELVIGPLLKQAFEITVVTPHDFDTDQFGTFTRDITRVGSPYETAKQKALAAAAHTGHTLALASEGSFGSHPNLSLLPHHTELVILVDTKHDIEIVGHHEDTSLKADGRLVRSVEEARAVAEGWGFPTQGVVVRASQTSNRHIYKELRTVAELEATVNKLLKRWFGSGVFLETDMRAHRCPQRMETIKQATADLIRRCRQLCPSCGTPGFVVREIKTGLPCSYCGLPTNQPSAYISHCQKCAHEAVLPVVEQVADPSLCARCNP